MNEKNTDKSNNTTIPLSDRLMVDAKSLAELLSCSVRHVQAMDSAGLIPMATRLRRRTLWHVPTIRRWCQAGCPPRDQWPENEQDDGASRLVEGRAG